jgi:hypothetical protein
MGFIRRIFSRSLPPFKCKWYTSGRNKREKFPPIIMAVIKQFCITAAKQQRRQQQKRATTSGFCVGPPLNKKVNSQLKRMTYEHVTIETGKEEGARFQGGGPAAEPSYL